MSFNPALLLEPRHCQVCHTRSRLKPCGSCKLVYYCFHTHRNQDQAAHEHPCNVVKYAVAALRRAEDQVRHDVFLNARFFVPDRRPCLREQLKVVQETLEHFKNITAVEKSIKHLEDMIRLNRHDDLCVRDILATLYLRLGRDQECYDFIKWWATIPDDHDFYDVEHPYLNVKYADTLECPAEGLRMDRRISLNHMASVTLIKVRILLDLQHMQNATRAFNGALPRELIDMIRGEALVSTVVTPSKDIIQASVETTAEMVQLVKSQIKMLVEEVGRRSPFWTSLIRYVEDETKLRGRSFSEETRAFMYNYDAWRETPGAVRAIKGLVETA